MKVDEPITPAKSTDITPASSPRTPEKCLSDEDQTPWTPTSNFKVLLKALSPEMKKKDRLLDEALAEQSIPACDLFNEDPPNKIKGLVGRKEKSLGVLCHK